jgi:uncharacterized protein (DUF488 family)
MKIEVPKTTDAPRPTESQPPKNLLLQVQQKVFSGSSGTECAPEGTPRKPRIVTLGVYGCDESGFFGALREAGVDTFCDLRFRRGVRGAEYAFVNSQRLQARLAEMGIRYLHYRELAPSQALRNRQSAADKAKGTAKRQRTDLSNLFVAGYREECLSAFDSNHFIESLGSEARVVALFCVERAPAACHRSLVAERLRGDLGLEVVHLTPGARTACAF